jgi:uncharacterized protein (TIGR04255 family)
MHLAQSQELPTPELLNEVFPNPPLREVDFEIRFSPRLKVSAELFRFQELIVADYPQVGSESQLRPDAIVPFTVFSNASDGRIIKVSQQSLVVSFMKYDHFEGFKDELLRRTEEFNQLFGIQSFTRMGLRYVNEIKLRGSGPDETARYVKPFLDFDRFAALSARQLFAEIRFSKDDHEATVRTIGEIPRDCAMLILAACHT